MKSAEDIKRYFKKATLSTNPDKHEAVFEKIQNAQEPSTAQTPVSHRLYHRSSIMKRPITKFAAAIIIIAVTLGLFEFISNGSGSGIVWAKVAEQVQASPGFTCRSNVILTDTTSGDFNQIDMRMYGSLKYGIRVDQYEDDKVVISNYGNRADNTIVSITHSTKTYTRRPLLKRDITNLEEMSPTKLVQKYLSTDYKELGTLILNGLEVEGIEVNDPSVISTTFPIESIVARLWVSKETGFPVRMEAKMTGNNGALKMEAVINELQWNIEFSASDFTPDIPSDYTLVDTP
jgi:outer membrane lipoprotein-sorting protein